MFKKAKQPTDMITDYAILLGGLAIAGLLIRVLRLSQQYIFIAIVPLSVAYVIWGVLHHKRHGHIDRKILLEYVGLAVLVNVIIFILVG